MLISYSGCKPFQLVKHAISYSRVYTGTEIKRL
uniref:Uncharacterized protein n=1 Tax=Arundo donax TaxID=35708 RepID=A0A0A8YWA7_ARUDO